LYTLAKELWAQLCAKRFDNAWNGCKFSVNREGRTAWEDMFAKDIRVQDLVKLRCGDVCPATGIIEWSSHSYVLFNSLSETGEDCCSSLHKGSLLPLGFKLTNDKAYVHVRVTSTRNQISENGAAETQRATSKRMERFPQHMNKELNRVNLGALFLLFLLAAWAADVSFDYFGVPSLKTHFFSTVVQLNAILPSMRWAMLYYFYIFMVQARAPKINIQNYKAFHHLDERKILYSDKTGTLTEEQLKVAKMIDVKSGTDFALDDHLVLAALMANNDSQKRFSVGKDETCRPGTNVEEKAIADYMEEKEWFIESNPLKPGSPPEETASKSCIAVHEEPLRLFQKGNDEKCSTIDCTVLSRTDFQPKNGYREARISLRRGDEIQEYKVRQGGADIMAELANAPDIENELASLDKNRALGWCVCPVEKDAEEEKWQYVLRGSFDNPVRKESPSLVEHCLKNNVAFRMMTGDAKVAAMHIALQLGLLTESICEYEDGEAVAAFADRLREFVATHTGTCSIVVPGSTLKEMIQMGRHACEWLDDGRVSAIIYRTKAADKAVIVRATTGCIMMGDAANDADAICDADVGICLSHGAQACKLNADFLAKDPGAVGTVRTKVHQRVS
jgi:magnesium-transporting ATPase (P-type)